MANHKSSEKRIRQTKTRNEHNRYYAKTMRNAVRKLRATTDKEEAVKMFPTVQKMLDKLAKTNIIHKNKAANLKSSLAQHIAKLANFKNKTVKEIKVATKRLAAFFILIFLATKYYVFSDKIRIFALY